MRGLGVFCALAVLAAAGGSAAQTHAVSADGSLTIDFRGLKSRRGVVLAALFDSRPAYDANKGPLRTWTLPADSGDFSVTVGGLKPGSYAVKAFHDIDGDGKMKFNPLGMPLEPYAFSNNARGMFGPPAWRAAAFTVAPGANDQAIRLK